MTLNRGFVYREQVNCKGAGRTVLEYLAGRYRHSSETVWKSRLEDGQVSLDGHTAHPDSPLKAGQWLVWRRPPWDEPDVPLSFAVLYKDDDLLAVAKPCGLPTVPAGGFLEHTLLTLVRRRYPEATPAHRLGRGTSGVVLFSLTAKARSALAEAWRQNEVTKVYLALASGIARKDAFTISVPIGPVPHPALGTLHAASPTGKAALSEVRVLERRKRSSLLKVQIETGKPHQIRIHLAAAGHPLVGDPLYTIGGKFKENGEKGAALPGDIGYFLHAERLRLRHPTTGAFFETACPPPPELRTSRGVNPFL